MNQNSLINKTTYSVKSQLSENGILYNKIFVFIADKFYNGVRYKTYFSNQNGAFRELTEVIENGYNIDDYETIKDFINDYPGYAGLSRIGEVENLNESLKFKIDSDISSIVNLDIAGLNLDDYDFTCLRQAVYKRLKEEGLTGENIIEKIVKPAPFKKTIFKYVRSADRMEEKREASKRETEEIEIQEDLIAQAIYEDFEELKGKKEKYGKDDIEELRNALSVLIEKFGRDKVKIFIRSVYFRKCVDRSVLEVLFPENFAIKI
ncbi:MAG: hypothetical protein EVJ47_03135 [Candidatus Acidulodesulfobacterium ferriphilum]|uniref:Uncharacterized protein n=1 Tax=Candidatus Acidulodesulfobacterium ferriphilum TaxID=2597223 RepID=A0A519BDD7_9DELT|nr:MAG: hypothetical protein EVJ47_03135 [Candidatus Acidulodesulfobacterium ferriphilum]